MKTMSTIFNEQLEKMDERGWDMLYVAVDWHDTMMKATYSNNDYGDYELYEGAEIVLQWLSECPFVTLILYTSSHIKVCTDFIMALNKRGIDFTYLNCNPEVPNTETGRFDEKFYYNVIIDDKAGFSGGEDWFELVENINYRFVVPQVMGMLDTF